MPRILSAGDPDDPVYTDVPDEDVLRGQLLGPDPERHGPANPATHCGICGRPLDAQLTCVACGDADDEEQAA